MAGELNKFKTDTKQLVDTGFRLNYNNLVDVVIFDVENDNNGNLVFDTNLGDISVPIPNTLNDFSDIIINNATSGQVLGFNGTAWIPVDFPNSSDIEYVRSATSTRSGFTDVGNITSVIDALDQILYPYEEPSFNSFSINSKATTLELGQELITSGGENVTFSWSYSNSSNISTTIGYNIDDNTSTINLSTNINSTFTSDLINIPYQIVKYSNGDTHQFQIEGTNTEGNTFTRTRSYTWRPRSYWGTSPNSGALSSAEILALTLSNTGGSELTNSVSQSRKIDGNGEHIHFVWDASLGTVNNILVGNLPNSAFTTYQVSFTNQYGFVITYNGLVSDTIQFGTGIDIDIS